MADLTAFATKDNADEGVVLPVRLNGTKIPLALRIYGSDSDTVIEYERSKIRKLGIGRKGKKDLDDDDIEELLENQDEAVVIRIGGIYSYDWKKKTTIDEPVILFDQTLKCDKESYKYLVDKMPAIKDWVMEQSNDRSNFLSAGKKN